MRSPVGEVNLTEVVIAVKIDIEELKEAGCDDGEILEANQVVAYFNYSNRLLNGLADGTNWVFRDESCHMNFALEVVNTVRAEEPALLEATWLHEDHWAASDDAIARIAAKKR